MTQIIMMNTDKLKMAINGFFMVTTHALLNLKADFELSKASFGLQKAWMPEFKAGFEPYSSKLYAL